jgi:hypothetical protein
MRGKGDILIIDSCPRAAGWLTPNLALQRTPAAATVTVLVIARGAAGSAELGR